MSSRLDEVQTMTISLDRPIIYPDSDSQPMADNTRQFEWIVLLKENLEILFTNDPNVFVAGDLLWYPVEKHPEIRVAPDTMVVFGRPKGHRGSYQQWQEEQIAPQVVFEILSPGNTLREMAKKQLFYNRYGVEEYYVYDPDHNDFNGFCRVDEQLDVIDAVTDWVSPQLGVRFLLTDETLEVYAPDGKRFLTTVELAAERDRAKEQAKQEQLRAAQAEERSRQLAEQLRSLGVDPDSF